MYTCICTYAYTYIYIYTHKFAPALRTCSAGWRTWAAPPPAPPIRPGGLQTELLSLSPSFSLSISLSLSLSLSISPPPSPSPSPSLSKAMLVEMLLEDGERLPPPSFLGESAEDRRGCNVLCFNIRDY